MPAGGELNTAGPSSSHRSRARAQMARNRSSIAGRPAPSSQSGSSAITADRSNPRSRMVPASRVRSSRSIRSGAVDQPSSPMISIVS